MEAKRLFWCRMRVIDKRDAEDAIARAEQTYGPCERLIAEIEKRQAQA